MQIDKTCHRSLRLEARIEAIGKPPIALLRTTFHAKVAIVEKSLR